MNLTKAEKVRLGTFVAVSLAVLAGGVLSLAGLKVWERRDVYRVRFKESVSGLENSAQVRYQGLRVGRVDGMRIAADDPSAIEVTLSLEAGTVLYQGTTAVQDASGLTGIKTINLTPGDAKLGKVEPGGLIPSGQSLFEKISGKAEQIAVKVEVVANQLAPWTSDDNRMRIEALFDSLNRLVNDTDLLIVDAREPLVNALEEVSSTGAAVRGTAIATTKTLNEVRDDLRGTLAASRDAVGEVARILKAVDSKQLKESITNANAAMKSLDTRLSKAELGVTIDRLSVALTGLTKLISELDLAVRASREDFVMSLKQVRQATEDLREFSRIIAQDPSVLLRGKEAQE